MEELPSHNNQSNFQQNNFFRSPNENSMIGSNVHEETHKKNTSKLFQPGHENNQYTNPTRNMTQPPFNTQFSNQSNKNSISASVQGLPKHNFYNQQLIHTKSSGQNQFPKQNEIPNKAFGYGLANNVSIEKQRGEQYQRKEQPSAPPLFQYHRQHLDEMTSLLRQVFFLCNPGITSEF